MALLAAAAIAAAIVALHALDRHVTRREPMNRQVLDDLRSRARTGRR